MRFYGQPYIKQFHTAGILLGAVILLFAGCGVSKQHQGVLNKWRDTTIEPFEKGQTTQSDIITVLGPPSQVIALNDQVVFYYMRENVESKGVFFLVFNWVSKRVSYDRAIFFFDQAGVLTEYAYSIERIPYEQAP